MKSLLFALFAPLIIATPICDEIRHSFPIEGIYIGYEFIGKLDPAAPQIKWYHKTILNIENDSVSIQQIPCYIKNSDTIQSASDGGFYTFKGGYNVKGNRIEIHTMEVHCDYCAQLVKVLADGTLEHINREKNIVGTIEKGGIRMDSMLYKRSTEKK